jgi:hypothetical protein
MIRRQRQRRATIILSRTPPRAQASGMGNNFLRSEWIIWTSPGDDERNA